MGDFELNDVLYFIVSKGGRVANHELVNHFKNVLNHPNNKVKNRNKFKDYVNQLATVKLDGGEKVLVLKKKYRPSSDTMGSSASLASSSSMSSSSISASASLSSLSKSPSSELTPAGSEPDLGSRMRPSDDERLGGSSPGVERVEEHPSQNASSPRARSEPPFVSQPHHGDQPPEDSVDGLGMSRMKSDESMEVSVKRSDRVAVPVLKVDDSYSVSGSTASLASTESQRSIGSSTSGVASMDDDANASIISVKDKIKNLNKIQSESDISLPRMQKKSIKHGSNYGGDDDDASHTSGLSYVTLSSEQKEWMITSSTSEYHDMNRLLSKNQNLARLKDFTNGYTALHWAAKSGKAEVIKLLANKPGVNVDQRSHGGYTPLHLAALHGHEHIIELLVQTFKADADLRDYSGKKAKQYLMNSASSKAQQLLVSRRLGSDLHPNKLSLDDSFIRNSMRMSNRAKAMSSLMQVKSAIARQPLLRSSWGGSTEELSEEGRDGSKRLTKTPPGSGGNSPHFYRRKHSKDADLMPPPSNSMMARRMRYSDRSKSSSRESLKSPKLSRRNDENLNIVRSESDPNMLDGGGGRRGQGDTIV